MTTISGSAIRSIYNVLIYHVQFQSNNDIKKVIFDLLDEIKKKEIFPPQEDGFPDIVKREINNGHIKIIVSYEPSPHGESGAYNPRTNTLVVFWKNATDINSMPSSLKITLIHELFHAYQDSAKKNISKSSELEGAAYLLEARYCLMSKGINFPYSAAFQVLTDEKGWFLDYSRERLSKLIIGALSNDIKVWEKESKDTGAFRFHQILLAETDRLILDFINNNTEINDDIEIKLSNGEYFLIELLDFKKMIALRKQLIQSSDPSSGSALVSYWDYWNDVVCAKRKAVLDELDEYFLGNRPNGTE